LNWSLSFVQQGLFHYYFNRHFVASNFEQKYRKDPDYITFLCAAHLFRTPNQFFP
jgi:hypothetical protein